MMRLIEVRSGLALFSHKVCINRALNLRCRYDANGICIYLPIFITYFDGVLMALSYAWDD